MRHPVASTLLAMAQSLRLAFEAVREDNALKGNLEQIWYSPPTAFDPACVNMVEQVEHSRGHSYLRSSSGAGYDVWRPSHPRVFRAPHRARTRS